MTRFNRLDCIASRAVDRLHSEPFTHLPMLRVPNGRSLIDHARIRSEGRGVFSQRHAPQGLQLGDRRPNPKANDFRMIAGGLEISLSVDRASHPDLAPRAGDQIDRITRGRRFAVVNVRPDGQARAVLILEEIQE